MDNPDLRDCTHLEKLSPAIFLLFEALNMYFAGVSQMVVKYLDDFFIGYVTAVPGDVVVIVLQPCILTLAFSGQETPLVGYFEQVD